MYNKLLLLKDFYKIFEQYEYILIHQLDAFIFRNDLEYWCKFGFDYFGAPWFKRKFYFKNAIRKIVINHNTFNYCRLLFNKVIQRRKNFAGNGGLSLRKVATCISFLENYSDIANSWKGNEDIFWSCVVPNLFTHFKVVPFKIALDFSFDTIPEICFSKNGNRLPFGCHAWYKYNINFWRPIFKYYGYTI